MTAPEGSNSGPSMIVVPGKPKFWGAYTFPPKEVVLPLLVNVRLRFWPWLFLVLGVLLLFSGIMFASILLDQAPPAFSLPSAFFGVLSIVFCAVAGMLLLASFMIAVADRFVNKPSLVLDAHGLFDRRLTTAPVPWTEICSARLHPKTKQPTVHLSLRSPIDARHNPLRAGSFGIPWRRAPDELYVTTMGLDYPMSELAHVILFMVRRNGGAIEPAWHFEGFDV